MTEAKYCNPYDCGADGFATTLQRHNPNALDDALIDITLLKMALSRIEAQRDDALQIINQAIPFVIAWANAHPGSEGDASVIGTRLVSRMQKALEKEEGSR